MSKLSAPNQRNVCLKDEFFHDLLDSAIGAAYSVERRFTYVEVADLIRVDIAEFLCASSLSFIGTSLSEDNEKKSPANGLFFMKKIY